MCADPNQGRRRGVVFLSPVFFSLFCIFCANAAERRQRDEKSGENIHINQATFHPPSLAQREKGEDGSASEGPGRFAASAWSQTRGCQTGEDAAELFRQISTPPLEERAAN